MASDSGVWCFIPRIKSRCICYRINQNFNNLFSSGQTEYCKCGEKSEEIAPSYELFTGRFPHSHVFFQPFFFQKSPTDPYPEGRLGIANFFEPKKGAKNWKFGETLTPIKM